VFLDVEGVPDRGFYYLVGIRYLHNAEHVERSFWADDRDDEGNIWRDFLQALQRIDDPIILHYGAYEARFIQHMKQRYSNGVEEDDFINQLVDKSVNLLHVIYGRVYFPTYSNSLKEIARFLGFSWTHPQASGGAALLMRRCYELTGDEDMRRTLVEYNKEDCRAVEVVTKALVRICEHPDDGDLSRSGPINVTSLEVGFQRTFGKFESPFPDFEKINQAAYWDYQREKVYVRSNKYLSRTIRKESKRRTRRDAPIDKKVQIEGDRPSSCTRCGSTIMWASRRYAKKRGGSAISAQRYKEKCCAVQL
jgi:RNase_H superfamily